MFLLTSDRLRVEISEPGERPNDAFRFDRSGFISEVTLDGATHFCANEPKNLSHPSTGGRGLCCEYTVDYSAYAEKGKKYPKLGVGLIPKGDEKYCFYTPYRDVEFFPVEVTHDGQSAEFHTGAIPCAGIAAETTKRITVTENTVSLEVVLSNAGEKRIVTDEYCHNFLSIDGMAISPDYRLELPCIADLGHGPIPDFQGYPCNFIADGKAVTFARNEIAVSMGYIPTGVQEDGPFRWKLSHLGAKAWVEVTDFVKPAKLLLWTADHIVSPEVVQHIELDPGQEFQWRRVWKFDAE